MKIKNIQAQTWIIVILLLLNLGTLSFIYLHKPVVAQPNFKTQKRIHHFMQKRLGLDAKQSNEFSKIQDKHFKEMDNIRKAIMEKKHELYGRILNNELNDEDVKRLTDDLAKLYAQQEMINYKHIKEIRAICTPEQSKKMNTIFKRILFNQAHTHTMYNRKKCYNNNH